MSYSAGEALILTLVQAATNFSSASTSRGKWGILNRGQSTSAAYAIAKPGPSEITWLSPTTYQARHVTIIQVWQRYKDDGDSLTNLEARVDNILTKLMPSRTLGDTTNSISGATVTSLGEVEEMWTKKGVGPAWLKQNVVIQWDEEVTVTNA